MSSNDDIAARKLALRSLMRKRLRGAELSPGAAGVNILQHLSNMDEWKNAQRVSVFLSYGQEPDTSPLILQAFAEHKTVLLPSWDKDTMRMEMVESSPEEYQRLKALQGPKNIPMPAMTGRWEPVDLFVVPGLAFDRSGGRLGHGWGYYDRYFAAYQRHFGGKFPPTIGIGHSCQLSPEPVPRDSHDFLVRFLVTPEGTIRCGE